MRRKRCLPRTTSIKSSAKQFGCSTQTISPCPALRPSRDKWGMGVRHALFPVPALGAHLAVAAGFPTLFSTASGVIGLVAGPSSVLRHWISSEAFQLAWAGGCATGLRTRSRHACESVPRLDPLALVGHRFWRCVGQGHGSRLLSLRLPFTHRPAVSFLTSPAFGRFSQDLPSPRVLPSARAPFVAPFGVFHWAVSNG